MTISSLASYYYNTFAFSSSSAYSQIASNSSAVSKNSFNVSNLSTALDALSNTASSGFGTLQNVDSFVKSAYQASQLDSKTYNKLSTAVSSSGVTNLLSGNTSLSGMYELLGSELSLSTQLFDSLFSSSASSSVIQSYTKNLTAENVASLLDIFA